MSAPIEQLLSRLDGVQKVKANGWKSRCPSHNGDGKSLAITFNDDGRILIHCFAHECEPGDILAAVGMSVGDLFPDRLPERQYAPMRHAMPAIDVLRVMKHEMTRVHIILSDIANGTADVRVLDDAAISAERLQKALDLCSG